MKTETREIRFHVPVALHKSFKDLSMARGFTLAGMLRAYVRQVTSMKHSLPTIEDATPSAEDLSEFLFTASQGRGKPAVEDDPSVEKLANFLSGTSQGRTRAKYWCRACDTHVVTSVSDDETCIKCGGYVIK
jgi:hypothetical protein